VVVSAGSQSVKVPFEHLSCFLRDFAEGPEETPVKEMPPVDLPIRPPEDLKCIQTAAGQRHQLSLHKAVQILERHPGDAVLVDHNAGAEGLHGVGHVGGEQTPWGAEGPALDLWEPVLQLESYQGRCTSPKTMPYTSQLQVRCIILSMRCGVVVK